MKYFYLDNFRGFQNALIPLLDVNFCVGENSSGKTSFLSMVHMFSSPKFWFEQGFEGSDHVFGNFDDIVSINAKNSNYFRVGIAEKVDERVRSQRQGRAKDDDQTQAYLFSFRRKDGMPALYKCSRVIGKHSFTFILSPKTIRYKFAQLDKAVALSDFGDGLFEVLSEEHAKTSPQGYKQIDLDFPYRGAPLYVFVTYLADEILEREIPGSHDRHRRMYKPFTEGEVAWIAPIRTKPRRTYDEVRLDFSPEGEHTPYVVKKILDSSSDSEKFAKFVAKFGSESGLFKSVKVHRFGKSVTSPFELDIILDRAPLSISSVGYGVSQALPVVVELFVRPKDSWFAIQQPEVHLHPRAQAAIGELMHELASLENKKFIVETHSDFTIDRFRVSHRESEKKPKAQILYFERKGGRNCPIPISIDEKGELDPSQPESYRKFFLKEELKNLGIE